MVLSSEIVELDLSLVVVSRTLVDPDDEVVASLLVVVISVPLVVSLVVVVKGKVVISIDTLPGATVSSVVTLKSSVHSSVVSVLPESTKVCFTNQNEISQQLN